jgi:hypothetical protein
MERLFYLFQWMFMLGLVCGLGFSLASAQEAAQEPAADLDALSPRNANYDIDAKLDPDSKMLEGRLTLTWRNIQENPTDELWFHLYWNAWKNNRSTWLLEARLRGRGDRITRAKPGDWSYVDVESARLVYDIGYPEADLIPNMRFASPDDGNPDDRTVVVLPLPTPVGPGETVQVEMEWKAKIPRTFSRTGFRGNYFFFAQWFPKVGVFEPDGWNCHQFHAGTEFYSDFGVYDVRLTVPESFVVGATGKVVERKENPDGTTTYRYQQADVHDFAWTASPDYLVREARFEEPGLPPVDMLLLLQPEHQLQEERHFNATKACLLHYGKWFGAYPYDHITIVDPAYGSGAGGMEYPTFFTCGSSLFSPFGGGSPEGVTIHECGHQFWFGVVGNNEFEFAWIDEGLNSYSDARTAAEAYEPTMLVRRYLRLPGSRRGFIPVMFEDIKETREVAGNGLDRYRSAATSDVPDTPTYKYFPGTGGAISYSKTAIWLHTLENYLGWETFQKIMSTFYDRWKFKHPRPQDFFDIANEVSGQDLTWFFDQVHRSAVDFDYAVQSVKSYPLPLKGYTEEGGALQYVEPEGEADVYRTEVIIRNNGLGIFPVEVLMVFEDGTEIRRDWDGAYRWKLFVEEGPAKLDYAGVDPDQKLVLDLNTTNNSQRLTPAADLPARKWASKWMIWLQDLLATFAFFI